MSHMLHVFPLVSLHELMPITDAYQWNAHDHFKQTTFLSLSHVYVSLVGSFTIANGQIE